MVKTFSHHSARATLRSHSGINEVSYSGALCSKGLAAIRVAVLAHGAGPLLVRFDKCVLLMRAFAPVDPAVFAGNMGPGVVVAAPGQYEMCRDFALETARFGLKRFVYRADELPLAREFAQDYLSRQR